MPESSSSLHYRRRNSIQEMDDQELVCMTPNPALRNRREIIKSSGYWSKPRKPSPNRRDDRLIEYAQEPRRRIFPTAEPEEQLDEGYHRIGGLIRRTSLTLAQENGGESFFDQRRRRVRRGSSNRSALSLTMRPFTRARTYVENAISPGMLKLSKFYSKIIFLVLCSSG